MSASRKDETHLTRPRFDSGRFRDVRTSSQQTSSYIWVCVETQVVNSLGLWSKMLYLEVCGSKCNCRTSPMPFRSSPYDHCAPVASDEMTPACDPKLLDVDSWGRNHEGSSCAERARIIEISRGGGISLRWCHIVFVNHVNRSDHVISHPIM